MTDNPGYPQDRTVLFELEVSALGPNYPKGIAAKCVCGQSLTVTEHLGNEDELAPWLYEHFDCLDDPWAGEPLSELPASWAEPPSWARWWA